MHARNWGAFLDAPGTQPNPAPLSGGVPKHVAAKHGAAAFAAAPLAAAFAAALAAAFTTPFTTAALAAAKGLLCHC